MKTLKETVEYIHNYMTEYDTSGDLIEKEMLHDMMEEELLDIAENVLTEEDMKARVASEDEAYLDKILNERLEDYPGLLEDIKNEVLNEFVSGNEE